MNRSLFHPTNAATPMRSWLVVCVLAGLLSLPIPAQAHDCTADDCGQCLSGTHNHYFANGTLICTSKPDPRDTPAPSIGVVLFAGLVATVVLSLYGTNQRR